MDDYVFINKNNAQIKRMEVSSEVAHRSGSRLAINWEVSFEYDTLV